MLPVVDTAEDKITPLSLSSVSLFHPLIQLIEKSKQITLSTHENSDGDGLGSEVALASVLKALGKKVEVMNATTIPRMYQFLPLVNNFTIFEDGNETHFEKLHNTDLFILLDTNHIGRTRGMKPHVMDMKQAKTLKVACIDHHLEPEDFADIMICESYAAATGELVYELIKAMETYFDQNLISKTVATGLYTAIMTDTASFKLPKTTAHIHHITAELLSTGISPMDIYEKIYNTLTPNSLQLIGKALNNIKMFEEDSLAYIFVTQEMLKDTGSSMNDTERLMDYLTGMPSTQISIMFVETIDGKTKVSMRSRGTVAVNKIAMKYGGGGHRNAAGCTIALPISDAIQLALADAKETLLKTN